MEFSNNSRHLKLIHPDNIDNIDNIDNNVNSQNTPYIKSSKLNKNIKPYNKVYLNELLNFAGDNDKIELNNKIY